METRARTPGFPGSTGNGFGGHIHQLLALATALARAATPPHPSTEADPAATDARRDIRGLPFGLDLGALADAEVVDWAQSLEHLGRFLTGMSVQVAGELADRVRAGRFDQDGIKTPVELLTTSLKLSRAEAYRRIRLAEHFLPTMDVLTAATTPPAQPVLGSAFFAGDVSTEQALIISSFTEEATHLAEAGRIPASKAHELEVTLTSYAHHEPPDFLRPLGLCAVNLLDPDGQRPTEGELIAKQGIFFRRPRRGLVGFGGHMTVLQYESTLASIDSATNPNQHTAFNNINTPHTTEANCGTCGAGTSTSGTDPTAGRGPARTNHTAGTLPGHGPEPTGPHQPLPGQVDVLDFLRTTLDPYNATGTGTGAGTSSGSGSGSGLRGDDGGTAPTSWPPPSQGPAPDWARTTAQEPLGTGWAPVEDDEGDWSPIRDWAHPPATKPPGTNTEDPGTEPTDTQPWPHLINGTSVPEPGSFEDLPGLELIDPTSTDPAVTDRRTHGQKLLDGLIDCLKLAARTGTLPITGGIRPQIFISTTQAELDRKNAAGETLGIALTPYSGPQPLAAFEQTLCDADITRLILGDGSTILNVGRTQRLFTTAQRKILTARDMGCTFPDCTKPAPWTEAHHIIPWKDGGETNINNAALLCEAHHHLIHQGAWTLRLNQGVPAFTPNYNLDPTRRERRNTYHHGLPRN